MVVVHLTCTIGIVTWVIVKCSQLILRNKRLIQEVPQSIQGKLLGDILWNYVTNKANEMPKKLEVFSEDIPRAVLWYIIVEQSDPEV